MTSDYELSVFLVKSHGSDVTINTIFEASSRLSVLCVPNVNLSSSCDIELKPDVREKSAQNRIVITYIRDEWFLILKNFEDSGSDDHSSMLGNNSHACNLINICDTKGLHLTIILDVPYIYDSLGVTCDETVKSWRAVNSN